LKLMALDGSDGLAALQQRLVTMAIAATGQDSLTRRARPFFLYVMYVLLLWGLPMGLVAAFHPAMAAAIARGITDYLAALPQPLYALFGTGYLGYTAARQWGKIAGSDK
ncbi:MAG TPA: 3TM-type holin, partial [Novosphingobium sp.]|nr:3TM-type holin [Novosphingobium sp.]